MSASFVLTLDTHAPHVTWGDITGADAGELLTVAYTVNEPGITAATLRLPSGTTLPMVVGPDALTVEIPGDSTMGEALLTATVEDELGNTGTSSLAIALGGVIPPVQTPPPTTGGLPRGVQFEPRVIRDASRFGSGSRDAVTALVSSPSVTGVRSSYVMPTTRRVAWRSVVTAQSTGQITGKMTTNSPTNLPTRPDVIRRREGPNQEDEMLLLDLLL